MKFFVINLLCEMTVMWCEQSGDQIIQFEWDRGLTILQPVRERTWTKKTHKTKLERREFSNSNFFLNRSSKFLRNSVVGEVMIPSFFYRSENLVDLVLVSGIVLNQSPGVWDAHWLYRNFEFCITYIYCPFRGRESICHRESLNSNFKVRVWIRAPRAPKARSIKLSVCFL